MLVGKKLLIRDLMPAVMSCISTWWVLNKPGGWVTDVPWNNV